MALVAPGSTLQLFRPAPHVRAFYDGRIPGVRLHSEAENWLDDGAFALGICSFAVVDGADALVYDTHISLAHARRIRAALVREGVRRIRVLLSHWHDDHVAGNAVFADCEIIATEETDALLRAHRARLEGADPPIRPLVLPTRRFDKCLSLQVGSVPVEVRPMDIHSRDGAVCLLPGGLLLAGDTLEDPITYVDEPERLDIHAENLRRMATWNVTRILPNHGMAAMIAAGGYGPGLITATLLYLERLLRLARAPELAALDLKSFAAAAFATGAISPFAPYEAVHRRNVAAVLEAARRPETPTHQPRPEAGADDVTNGPAGLPS